MNPVARRGLWEGLGRGQLALGPQPLVLRCWLCYGSQRGRRASGGVEMLPALARPGCGRCQPLGERPPSLPVLNPGLGCWGESRLWVCPAHSLLVPSWPGRLARSRRLWCGRVAQRGGVQCVLGPPPPWSPLPGLPGGSGRGSHGAQAGLPGAASGCPACVPRQRRESWPLLWPPGSAARRRGPGEGAWLGFDRGGGPPAA